MKLESNGSDVEAGDEKQQIMDKDELSHLRKQQKIEDTREKALDMRTEAYGRMVAGQISPQTACQQYRGVVNTLLVQLVPLIEQHAPDSEYLHEVPIGELEFQPPEELIEYAEDNIIRMVDGCRVPTTESIEIQGLKTVLEAGSPLQASWHVTVKRKGGPETREASVQQEMSFRMIDKALQHADRAMEELGVGMNTDDSETYKIE